MTIKTLSVAILAHNESGTLARAVDSVLAQQTDAAVRITILENGSTDDTAARAAAMARREARVTARSLPLGDKSNAWNHYIFNEAGDWPDAAHVFMDGDVVMRPGALAAFAETLSRDPDALASAALPYGGRTAEAWRARVLTHCGLPGNLYALGAGTVRRLRNERWCLPVGSIGDDTFLLWLLRRRLDPFSLPDKTAIAPARGAGFEYDSIPARSVSGVRQLIRRQRTYALRDVQTRLLIDHLKAARGNRPPLDVVDLYAHSRPWTLFFGPFGRVFPLALRKTLFLDAWWRTRNPRARTAPAWFETPGPDGTDRSAASGRPVLPV